MAPFPGTLSQADSDLLLFTLMGKKDCFRFPIYVRWCIEIRNKHVQKCNQFGVTRGSQCDAFVTQHDRLDAVVNNAGIMACPHGITADGFETQIGSNHLGHFLLQQLLAPLLLKTAERTKTPSRFITLSSVAAAESSLSKVAPDIHLDDVNWHSREYDAWQAYGASKLANYLHTQPTPRSTFRKTN